MQTSSAVPKILRLFGRVIFAALLATMTLAETCNAQTDASISEPANTSFSRPDTDNSDSSAENTDLVQLVKNLETGAPLKVLLTPFHWGRVSLLSFSGYQGYDSNPRLQGMSNAASFAEFGALVLSSSRFAGWQLDLQYQPFLSFSPKRTNKSFSAAALDLQTVRHLNRNWSWAVSENLRYSPDLQSAVGTGLVLDSAGGISIGNISLSAGRSVLADNAHLGLSDRYSEHSSLAFHVDGNFTRLSSYLGTQSEVNLPTEEAHSYATGVVWSSHLNLHDTISLKYDYRVQSATGTPVGDVDYHTASIGWGHRLKPSLRFSATIGPGWSKYTGHQGGNTSPPWHTTLQGSLGLAKQLRRGAVALVFARSNNFSGVISDSFNNRYDLTLSQSLSARWSCAATTSYLQQQVSRGRATAGEQFSLQLSHFLSRNWAIFAQGRYLKISGSEQFAAEKIATVGFRWSWEPDKP
jgi:hypothetical protein